MLDFKLIRSTIIQVITYSAFNPCLHLYLSSEGSQSVSFQRGETFNDQTAEFLSLLIACKKEEFSIDNCHELGLGTHTLACLLNVRM